MAHSSSRTPVWPAQTRSFGFDWRWVCRLSLLEPAVAVIWHLKFARLFDAPLRSNHIVLLFTSLWLVYMADRLMDVWRLPNTVTALTERHRFAQQNSRLLLGLWCLVAVCAMTLALCTLTGKEWVGCSLVLCTTFLYLRLVHGARSSWRLRERGAKELGVALVFALGSTVFVWSSLFIGSRSHAALLAPAGPTFAVAVFVFAALALHNVVHLSRQERHIDVQQDSPSIAWSEGSDWAERGVCAFLVASAVVNALLVVGNQRVDWLSLSTLLPVTVGAALGSLVIRFQDLLLPDLSDDARHVVADLAVLCAGFPALLVASPLLE